MTQYGAFSVFQRVTADSLNATIPQYFTKASLTSITSSTTLTNDAELSGIPLGVGTWEIEVLLFVGAATGTGNFKTAWAFTGAVANSPIRAVMGPNNPNAGDPKQLGTTGTTASGVAMGATGPSFTGVSTYGIGSATSFAQIREDTADFQVSTAGLFSVQVAQNVSNASATTIRIGSRIKIRQVG